MAIFIQPGLGELRHSITIEGITSEVANQHNEMLPVYDTLITRFAKIVDQRPEALQINQANTRANLEHVEITIRYWQGLNVNNRIRYGGINLASLTGAQLAALTASQYEAMTSVGNPPVYYRITGIADPDHRKRWQIIQAVGVTG